MWELDCEESWAPKNWCFWTVVLEKTLESPLGLQGDPIQPILKEISPEYSLEGLMLKLKLQYFGHLMWRTYSLEKTLMLGKIEGCRRRGQQRWDGWMASPMQFTWVWASSRSWWWTGWPGRLQPMVLQRVGHDWATGLNWLRTCCIAQGALPNALWRPKWEVNPKKRGCMYLYSRFTSMYSRNECNVVKQLYHNEKEKKVITKKAIL